MKELEPNRSLGGLAAGNRLLLVDDDERFNERLARALRVRSIDVTTAQDAEQALIVAANQRLDGVVTDLRMPQKDGLFLVRELHALYPDLRIVVLTGYGSIATAVEAMRLGAAGYLVKPCNADQVLHEFGDVSAYVPTDADITIPSLARLEREHIERVLVECGGNVTQAAKVLGIHRRTLQYKLAKFSPQR